MPTVNLTSRWVESLKPSNNAQIDYFDERLTGFGLRLSPRGRKTWFCMYRHSGRLRRLSLGTYPALTLADARDQAKSELAAAAKGNDPAAQKKAERLAETFGELATEYLEKYAKPNKRSWQEDERLINKELLPKWKLVKAKNIKRRDVIRLLDEIQKRGAPIQANRVLALVRKMFNWAIGRDLLNTNPCYQIKALAKENRRDRVLSEEEIQIFWSKLDECDMTDAMKIALKLQLVTAQRKIEIVSAKWEEVDLRLKWWTIPSEKSKNSLSHRVPLSELAIELLNELKQLTGVSDYLFPSPRGNYPIKETSVDHAIRNNRKIFNLNHFTPHDLRRTAASQMTSTGIPRLVVSKILNHVESGVTAVYDRHSYDSEKLNALTQWSKKLRVISSDKISKPIFRRAS